MALKEIELDTLWLQERASHISTAFTSYKGRHVSKIGGKIGEWFEEQGLFYQVLTGELELVLRSGRILGPIVKHHIIATEETILLFKMTWL